MSLIGRGVIRVNGTAARDTRNSIAMDGTYGRISRSSLRPIPGPAGAIGVSSPAGVPHLDGVPDSAIVDERRRVPRPPTRGRARGPGRRGGEEPEGTVVPDPQVARGQECRS